MSASRHWEEDGFERRSNRARRMYRRAEIRARRRTDLWSEVVRYLLVTALLLIFVRPIGVIVALLWGCSLWSRYSRLDLEPRLRDRWTEVELAREHRARAHRSRPRRPGRRRRRTSRDRYDDGVVDEAERLLTHIGDDPTSTRNLEQARQALASVERLGSNDEEADRAGHDAADREKAERAPAASQRRTLREVRMADVLEDAIAGVRPRMRRNGVALDAEFDSPGVLRADAAELRRIFRALIDSSLDALEWDGTEKPLIEVHMGENLARTQVWVRIRHNGPQPDPDALDALLRPGIECESDADDDCVLTFDKRRGGVDDAARANRPSGSA